MVVDNSALLVLKTYRRYRKVTKADVKSMNWQGDDSLPSNEDGLVGLVVRCLLQEWKIPGSNPACVGIFRGQVITVT